MIKIITRIVHAMTLLWTALLLTSCEIEGSSEMIDLSGEWTVDKEVYETLIDDTWIPLMIWEERLEEESGFMFGYRACVHYFPEDKKSYLLYDVFTGNEDRNAIYLIRYVNGRRQKVVRIPNEVLSNVNHRDIVSSYFGDDIDDNTKCFGFSINTPWQDKDIKVGDKIIFEPFQFANGTYSNMFDGYRMESNGEMKQVLRLDGYTEYEELSKHSFCIYSSYKKDLNQYWHHNGERISEIEIRHKHHFKAN